MGGYDHGTELGVCVNAFTYLRTFSRRSEVVSSIRFISNSRLRPQFLAEVFTAFHGSAKRFHLTMDFDWHLSTESFVPFVQYRNLVECAVGD